MITFKCGTCGIEYNIQEQNIIEEKCSQACPNCKTLIPSSILDSLREFLRRIKNQTEHAWTVSVVTDKEPKGSITGTLY